MERNNDKSLCHKVFMQMYYSTTVPSLIIINNAPFKNEFSPFWKMSMKIIKNFVHWNAAHLMSNVVVRDINIMSEVFNLAGLLMQFSQHFKYFNNFVLQNMYNIIYKQ